MAVDPANRAGSDERTALVELKERVVARMDEELKQLDEELREVARKSKAVIHPPEQ